jgi:ligand-binding sensor domain-containing protein/two-component sensor histidine kinase
MLRLIASLLIFAIVESNAQLPATINFINYTRANGLPEENINNIVQDSRGFLWIGTREGLIRFDGNTYKTWYSDPADSSKFNNNNIALAGEMEKGKLYFLSGTSLWHINIYNHKLEKAVRFVKKELFNTPQQVGNDTWCSNDLDSLYLTNRQLQSIHTISLRTMFPVPVQVGAFRLHHPYVLVYGNGNHLIFLLNYLTGKYEKVPVDVSSLDSRSRFFKPVAYDSSLHRLYLSSYFNGVFQLDLHLPLGASIKVKHIDLFADGAIRKAMLLSNNRLMMGGDNGLYITDFNHYTFFNSASRLNKPMNSNVVLDICQSKDNNYWLSTTNGFTRFSLSEPLIAYWRSELPLQKGDEIKYIHGDGNTIYFLSQQKSLFSFNKENSRIKRLDSSLFYCWSGMAAGSEITVTGAGKRLAIYNTITGRMSNPDFLQPFYTNTTDLVTLVFKSKNGDIWYSINGGAGLIRHPAGTNEYLHYNKNLNPPSFSHSYVHTATEDKEGNIWWGSNKSPSLLKWSPQTESFTETSVDQLNPIQKLKTGISGLYADANNNLWIALDQAGLLRYNLISKTGDYYDINRGLPADAVYGMCADKKNRLWFGTRKGLCCYLPDRDKIITFTTYDGFPEDDFEGDGIYFSKEDNLLYIGAKQSIASFNPDSLLLKSTSYLPPVFIDEMQVNGKVFYFEDEKSIQLKTKENNIEFSFASPDYNRNNQLILQYQLKGVSKDWIDLGNKRNVTFNSLPHGKYIFSVRCKYKGTENWQETAYPFTFTIKTPLTKTWWFRTLIALAILLFAGLLIRNYYLRKLEKQKAALEKKQAVEKERTRIATDMHDDFGASLSRIKFISEKMQLTQNENVELKTDLTKISVYSDEMAEKMNEIVWALNQRYDSYADLVSFCRSYASELLQDKNIKLHFSTGDIPEKKIQGEVRRNIFLVMKEALHNILKHSDATEAGISFLFGHEIQMSISDNGKGFDNNSIRPFANGLENMKKRMTDINGTINISGDKGTSIVLTVPI